MIGAILAAKAADERREIEHMKWHDQERVQMQAEIDRLKDENERLYMFRPPFADVRPGNAIRRQRDLEDEIRRLRAELSEARANQTDRLIANIGRSNDRYGVRRRCSGCGYVRTI